MINDFALGGNWIDFVIVVFVAFYLWEAWGKSFIPALFDLLAFIASFVLALKFYPLVAQLLIANFSFPRSLANASGFFIIGLLVEQIFSTLLVKVEQKTSRKWQKIRLDAVAALLPTTGNALVIVTFILMLVMGLPINGGIKTAITESKIGNQIVNKAHVLEKELSDVFGGALLETFNFITINPSSAETVKLNFTQKELSIDESSQKAMIVLINQERQKLELPSLTVNGELRDLAIEYAQDMFERGYFSHYNPEGQSPFDRMQLAGIDYLVAGENLAFAPSVDIAHQGLMNSPGHRKNILSPDFGQIGVGVIDGGIYGKMFVQEFTN